MGEKVALLVEERKVLGKKVAQLRKQGMVPGVVYGHDLEATPVMAPFNTVAKVWREVGVRQPVELTIGDGGTKRLAMIKSAEFDPVKRSIRHLSLHVVKQNEKVETEVPVRIEGEGETEAERAGLIVLQAVETLKISALPNVLPEEMFVPGSKLVAEGDHVTVADVIPIDGVEVLTEGDIVVANVYSTAAIDAQNAAAAGGAEEPSGEAAEEGGAEGEAPAGDEAKAESDEAKEEK